MALIKCPECGREISDRAKVCPGCGIDAETIQQMLKEYAAERASANQEGDLEKSDNAEDVVNIVAVSEEINTENVQADTLGETDASKVSDEPQNDNSNENTESNVTSSIDEEHDNSLQTSTAEDNSASAQTPPDLRKEKKSIGLDIIAIIVGVISVISLGGLIVAPVIGIIYAICAYKSTDDLYSNKTKSKIGLILNFVALLEMVVVIFFLHNALPGVKGKTPEQAVTLLIDMDMNYTVNEEYEFSDSVERGLVTRIDPASGKKAKAGSEITVYVSKGSPVIVPDITNQTRKYAEGTFEELGLKISFKREFSDEIDKGNVIKTDPVSDTPVEYESTVTVYLSKGSPITIPDVSNQTVAEAEATLTALGLKVSITEEYSDTVEKDIAIETNPHNGTEVEIGTNVTLIGSCGPHIYMPNVIGLSKEEAIELLKQNGISYSTVEEYNEAAKGTVVSASKNEGDEIVSETVALRISKGTKEQEIQAYKASCETPSYDDLIRNPTKYASTPIKLKVKITKIEQESILGIQYDTTIWATYKGEEIIISDDRANTEPSLREGDTVTVYGTCDGTRTIAVKEKQYQGSLVFGFSYNKTVDEYEVPNISVTDIDF